MYALLTGGGRMSSPQGAGRSLDTLVEELNGTTADQPEDPASRTESVVEETTDALFSGENTGIDDGLIKQSLPELLVMLVGLRSNDTHGKGIMEDLNRFFGAQLSPGTVYPALHELEADGLLEMRELIQTKEYAIDDTEAVRETMEKTMQQHLALGLLFQRTIEEIDESADDA